MQNRYTGDIGDFGKYGLLRALTQPQDGDALRLGVVWYLTGAEDNRDGRQVQYLSPENRKGRQLMACDEGLYDRLAGIVREDARQVAEVQNRRILPEETRFHRGALDPRAVVKRRGSSIGDIRLDARERWHEEALRNTEGCQLVFLDPDNGLELAGMSQGDLRAHKYAFYSEVRSYLDRGQSLVVYHHLNRSVQAMKQVHQRQMEIFVKMQRRALVMRYHRGSPRAFILIPQAQHREELTGRVRRMMEGPWARHFSMIG